LRQFSQDERTLAVLLVGEGKTIDGAPLRQQCYEDYFYGHDGGIENAFAAVEGRFTTALGDLSRDHLDSLSENQIDDVRLFVHYQRLRTRGAADEVDEFNEALAKNVLSKDDRFKDLDFEKVRIKTNGAQFNSLHNAMTSFPLALDLEIKFLVSDKKLGFVVSDDPVLSYNQYVEHHPVLGRWPAGSTGLGLKGLQLFLPVSPRVCVAMYDPGSYVFGSIKRRTCDISVHDIRFLNSLQAVNARDCVYFHPDFTPNDELDPLRREHAKHLEWRKPRFFESPLVRRPDGLLSQLVMYSRPDLRFGARFGFVRVTDRTSYEGYDRGHLPVRSERLMDLAEQYNEFIEAMIKEKRAGPEGSGDIAEVDAEQE
jgi:hypothetical protein